MTAIETLKELVAKSDGKTDGPCIHWPMATGATGYGVLSNTSGSSYAHRAAYELTYGEIPEGLQVCHQICEERVEPTSNAYRTCVNPSHLKLGTAKQNSADMVRRGRAKATPDVELTDEEVAELRQRYADGEKGIDLISETGIPMQWFYSLMNGKRRSKAGGPLNDSDRRFKLDAKDVKKIRQLYAKGDVTQEHLAETYGVTLANIQFIVTGKTWKNAGGPIHVSSGVSRESSSTAAA